VTCLKFEVPMRFRWKLFSICNVFFGISVDTELGYPYQPRHANSNHQTVQDAGYVFVFANSRNIYLAHTSHSSVSCETWMSDQSNERGKRNTHTIRVEDHGFHGGS